MIIDQLFTRPLFEEEAMASPEQLAYNRLRAQWDGYQAMTSGGGNTAVSRDPAHAAKLATIPTELARMAAALKAKGIDAEAQYDALSGPKSAPVDANQAYGESGLRKFSHKKNRFRSLHKLQNPLGEEGTGGSEGSLNEFAPGGEDGNSPYAYGMAILGYAEDYKQIHRKSSSTDDDVADIIEIGNTFLNKGMAAGIAALFSVDTFVSDSIVDDLAEQGFNVMADLIDKRPRSAQWHQQMAAGQQALADYEANRKKSSEETDGSKAVDTLARVLKSSLKDYQAADGDKNKLKQLGLLIGLSDNHRSAIHHALQQIQQNDFDGAIKSLVATPPGASGPGYDALDYGYSKQKAGVSVQQLIQFIRKHFELSEQGVAEVAPPGAKAERMVKHIKQGYAKDGKLTPKEKGIAFATAWKAHNAGQVEEDLSRRGFLKGAGAAATMAAAGPEIVTLVKGFAEQAGGMNGIQALKAMLKIATPDELYNMYDYYADSGIMSDAITQSDMIALDRAGYDNWSDFEEHCDENSVDPDDEFERLTGQPLKVKLVDDILGKVDDTWSLEDFFDQYPEAMNIINPPRESLLSMRQLANIDTAAKGAHLPAPIVAMANAVSGLVRQIFKSNGQPLAAPHQTTAHHTQHTPALPAPTRPEFDMTPDLKQKEKVPVQRKGDDEEPEDPSLAPEDPRKLVQRLADAGAYSRGALQDIIDGTDKSGMMTKERAQELLNKHYGPQKPSSSQNRNQGVAEGVAETVSMDQAKKVLRHYGADHFKTTTNELHFYKNGRPMSVDLIFNDDATRSVNLSQLNSATRRLKGQGVAEGSESKKFKVTYKLQNGDVKEKIMIGKDVNAVAKYFEFKYRHKPTSVVEQGVAEGYTGRETKAGTWRVFKDGNAVAAAGPFKSADDAAAWIKKHKQGITEMDKSEPSAGRDGGQQSPRRDRQSSGRDTGPRSGPDRKANPITAKKATKDMGDVLNQAMSKEHKKDVKESDPLMLKLRRALIKEGRVKELADDLKTMNDADFMKKYGKAKAAIRKDMTKMNEARTDYTPDEMADMLSGKRSQKQIDADAERTRGPNKAPPTKESTQSRARRLNEKLTTSDTLSRPAAGASSSGRAIDDPDIMGSLKSASTPKFDRFSKTGGEPELDFRTGLGDNETEIETDPRLAAEPNKYMQSWGGKFAVDTPDNRPAPGSAQWQYVINPDYKAEKEVQWIPSSEADSIASWKANNPGKSAADWGSIPAASKSSAVGGSPKMRWNSQIKAQEKFDPRTGTWVPVPADGSGANPNIDAATRDRARAWAAQQNAPGAALAGAMRSSGNPVDTEKKKADWKSIYNLNKSIIGDNPNSIKPGMKLKMPDGSTYRVQPGDNLSKIAAGQINELSTNKLAQYKTAAAKDAKEADKAGDFKRGDKRFHGIVQATKKQFDNDDKKVDESRAARRALMARIVNSR